MPVGGTARYILDTNVVSALRVRDRHPKVAEWVASVPLRDQYLTAVTVGEIERGVVTKERSDPEQGGILRRWLEEQVLRAFGDRILAFDLAAARAVGAFRVPERASPDDALIAAIASARDMTIVSRNVKHFAPLGVPTPNPWEIGVSPT